jgi:acyl CoA:acetate/3-ketoacid CoA transferase alpha subunit
MSRKIYDSPQAALDGVLFDNMTIMSGGFGLSGNPESLIPEFARPGSKTSPLSPITRARTALACGCCWKHGR